MNEKDIADRLDTLEYQTKTLALALSEMMAPEVARDLLARFGLLREQLGAPSSDAFPGAYGREMRDYGSRDT